ncbi:glycosyltransferase [Arthrobacter sp. 31Y]|uniref:glycosyltransferase n=1 Tax=Arthrobacter sp. 31Y TaxID=1115632 RepID=UPI000464E99B|nr:glycosyltransferase [Arthrobacter sp. 31Y]
MVIRGASGKILHVVDRIDGGVPKAVRGYIENSPPEFHHAVLSPFINGRPAPVWNGLGITHHDLGQGLLGRIAAVKTTVSIVSPSVIHAHSSFSGVYTRAKRLGSPVVYEPHCFKHDDPHTPALQRMLYQRVEKFLARRTWKFGTLTSHETRLVRELKPEATCVRIPNLPSIPRTDAPRTSTVDVESPVITMVGRISRQKDPAFFQRVSSAVRREIPGARFQWIGDGDPALRWHLEEGGIEVTGWLPSAEVATALAASSVYVHSAAYEGFPLSVLDAAAQGIPVAARAIPAFEGSGLMQAHDPDGVAELVRTILREPQAHARAQAANQELLDRMNSQTLQTALRDLYARKGSDL